MPKIRSNEGPHWLIMRSWEIPSGGKKKKNQFGDELDGLVRSFLRQPVSGK